MHVATRIFICRPESYIPSDIHLGGVTLSVMLHTSLHVQCYFNKTQKSQNKQTREKGKRKKNTQTEKRPGQVKLGQ